MLGMLGALLPRLPHQRPRHLLGVADELGVPPSVALGIDTFDSCYPTRLGRHGTLLTPRGRLKISQKQYRDVHTPPPGFEDDLEAADWAADGAPPQHTLAYLHHLWKANEPLVFTLLALHNIRFMGDMCRRLREQIRRDEI